MNRRNDNQFLILVLSAAGLGLVIESYLLGWEFWVPPLIIIGIIMCWTLHITNKFTDNLREVFYFAFVCFVALFHGVHLTSLFDVSVVAMLLLITLSIMNRNVFLHVFMLEYLLVIVIQIVMAVKYSNLYFGTASIFRLILHVSGVLLVYLNCIRQIQRRLDMMKKERIKDKQIEAYDEDMEDFLSNISHELRTPVNVVNGMSDLLIKRNVGSEVLAIKEAGIRLANQIEDILDYTETKRKKLILEEEDYQITSLINDIVAKYRSDEENKRLELVVDLSSKVPGVLRGDIKKLHKIFRHLLENAIKFTTEGGIYISVSTEDTGSGTNLCIEVIDTGAGMDRKAIYMACDYMYQKNKKRNRSSGGIGLGLSIIYGFVHRMGGFVRIESEMGQGTTVRVTIPQKVVDSTPSLRIDKERSSILLLHVRFEKYKVTRVREFYRNMIVRLASELETPIYQTETVSDIQRMINEQKVSHIFMGEEEYWENASYFDELSRGKVVVTVSAGRGFSPNKGSEVLFMPKPLYAYPIIRILNEGKEACGLAIGDKTESISMEGLKVLVVDDEYMNLVVATGIFRDYGMVVETASNGKESIEKFKTNDYDVIFMDHMMPEMDGVETMHRIREVSREQNKPVIFVALTANVVSGAKEMFAKEGFDGFIAKPVNRSDFERAMARVLSEKKNTAEVNSHV
ncbi:MAG: response regulator [Lachnospiraceae bacterium]|nr:response regulator [Lachnospiraceae bacterium]